LRDGGVAMKNILGVSQIISTKNLTSSMDSQDIRFRAGGFDCEKVQKIIFFAIAFSSMPKIAPIRSAIQNLFQRLQTA
jgi:hypothetical protein